MPFSNYPIVSTNCFSIYVQISLNKDSFASPDEQVDVS